MNKISCNVTDHALAISTLHVMRTAACLLWVRGCLKVLQMPNECHVTVIRINLGLQNHTVFLLERIICSTAVDIPWPYLKSKVVVRPKKWYIFSFGLYCAITIAFHLQACYIYTGFVLHSDEVLVIVGFVVLSNGQFVVLLVSLGLLCIYSDFQAFVGSLVLLWFMSFLMVLVFVVWAFTLASLVCMSEASLTSHVTSHTGRVKTRRDLDKGKTKNLPQGFRSLRWSRASSACLIKGVFTQRRQPRTRDVSPRSHRFIILLFTTILSEEYTSTQRRAWQADHVHVIRGYRSRHGAAIAWSLLTN